MEEENVGGDSMITDFATYEDFLDSQITVADLFYLEVSVFFVIFGTEKLDVHVIISHL